MIVKLLESYVLYTREFIPVVAVAVGLLLAFLVVFVFPRFKSETGRMLSGLVQVVCGILVGIGLSKYKDKLPPKE